MLKIKKAISLILAASSCMLMLSGCGDLTEKKDPVPEATNDPGALISGTYYIWHDEEHDLNHDLKKASTSSNPVFTPLKVPSNNFKGEEKNDSFSADSTDTASISNSENSTSDSSYLSSEAGETVNSSSGQGGETNGQTENSEGDAGASSQDGSGSSDEINTDTSRMIWYKNGTNADIPTFYKGDAILMYRQNGLPENFTLERFYDDGYTVGFFGLQKIDGHYVFKSPSSSDDASSQFFPGNGAEFVTNYMDKVDYISLMDVGGVPIDENNMSVDGTILGLSQNKTYKLTYYVGTNKGIAHVKANIRTMHSVHAQTFMGYDLVGNHYLKVNLPKNLENGYYFLDGIGFFRYVNDTSYDKSTNFNGTYTTSVADSEEYQSSDQGTDGNSEKNEDATGIESQTGDGGNSNNTSESQTTSDTVNTQTVTVSEGQTGVHILIGYQDPYDSNDAPAVYVVYYNADQTSQPTRIDATEGDDGYYVIQQDLTLTPGNWNFEVHNLDKYKDHNSEITAQ